MYVTNGDVDGLCEWFFLTFQAFHRWILGWYEWWRLDRPPEVLDTCETYAFQGLGYVRNFSL